MADEPASAAFREEIVVEHATAMRVFGSPNVDFGLELSQEFQQNLRILGQIYDTIQRFLVGETRLQDRFYPDTEDLYRDLQLLKRSVSDKTPMPDEPAFRRLLRLLATARPPFIHFIREFMPGPEALNASTMYAAPTEKHPDKVLVAYKAALRNSMNTVKDLVNRHIKLSDFEERLRSLKKLEDLELGFSRVDVLLRSIFIRDRDVKTEDGDELVRIKRINENINRFLYRPLLQQLFRDGQIISLSVQDIRSSGIKGAEKFSDLFFFNDPVRLEERLKLLSGLLDSSFCWPFLDRARLDDLRSRHSSGQITENDFNGQLAGLALQALQSQALEHPQLLELAVEIDRLSVWARDFQKKHRQEKDKDDWQKLFDRLAKHKNLVRITRSKLANFNQEHLKQIVAGRVPQILALTDPVDFPENAEQVDLHSYSAIFLLLKDRNATAGAIDGALELFSKSGDPFLIRVLEDMLDLDQTSDETLKQYIGLPYINKLREGAAGSYWPLLPWWQRFYYTFTGRDASTVELKSIKKSLRIKKEMKADRRRAKRAEQAQKIAGKEIKTRARERMAEEEKVNPDHLKILSEIIESQLDQGRFPDRHAIAGLAGGAREDITRLLGLIDVGAQSLKTVRRIPLPINEGVYVTVPYVKEHRSELLELCRRGVSDVAEVVVGSEIKMALKDPTKSKQQLARDDYRTLLKALNQD